MKARSLTANSMIRAEGLAPFVTWGTSPGMVVPVTGHVPDPARARDPKPTAAV